MEYVVREDPIDLLRFSTRVSNRLKSMKLMTIGDYLDYPEDDWIKIKNLGIKSVNELIETKKALIYGKHPFFFLVDKKPEETDSPAEPEPPHTELVCGEVEGRRTFIALNGEELFDVLVEDLPLSVRSLNCLRNAHYLYASELLYASDDEILSIRNAGKTSLKNIRDVLSQIKWEVVPGRIREDEKSDDGDFPVEEIASKLNISRAEILRQIEIIREQYPVAAGESLVYLLFDTEPVRHATYGAVLHAIDTTNGEISIFSLEERLPKIISNTTILEELLLAMERKKDITFDGVRARRRYPSILDYISKLSNEKVKDMLGRKVSGETLEAIGSTWGITRERVRQIILKEIRKRPRVEEDQYLPLYSSYQFSRDAFRRVFGCEDSVYNYLELVCSVPNKDKKPLEDILTEETVKPEIRRACEIVCNKNKLYLGGNFIPKTRYEILRYAMKTYCTEIMITERIIEYYNLVLAECGLAGDQHLELNISTTYNWLNDVSNDYALACGGHRFRYYDIYANEYDDFFQEIKLEEYQDIELSTLKIFRDYPEIMREYDIRDEYELHSLLRRICRTNTNLAVKFGKSPTITIGWADRDKQLLDLLKETAPINRKDFAKAYEDLYGAKAATVLGSYVKVLEMYLVGDIYKLDFAKMPYHHIGKMQRMLTEPVYRISEIENLYYSQFPDAPQQLVNAYTLREMGYEPQGNYAYSRSYKNAADCFRHMLLNKDIVDTTTFPAYLHTLQAYTSTQLSLRMSRTITDYLPGKYINISRLEQIGVTKDTLESYCADVANAVPRGSFFTIESLRNTGFVHSLDDLGFEPWFYSSVLAADKKRFSIRRLGSTRLIYSGEKDIQLSDLIVDIIEREQKYEIHDLTDYLSRFYGVTIQKDNLLGIIHGTDLYYDKIMETVYVDYDTYFEEV